MFQIYRNHSDICKHWSSFGSVYMHMPNHGSWPNSMLHLDQFVMKVLHICGHARQGNEKVEEGSTH